ncbi:TIM barrel protein [Paenibacillus sp. LMG 31458]|uniref:TIM barrel protein n=1 Tax=Paenibacillus phytorum TaxID=2654977 RepID=A0ABX1Y4W3_9BACL|nr:sugar phosphate isomerase/epimerase [Paenibacillus phytorum]NOU75791.1 TIM barrel protein [Paenibacillus phytorum]
MRSKFAAQLFTLRDELEKDYFGTLRKVREMGWQAVQISGLFGNNPADIAKVLQETGLLTAGIHVGLAELKNQLDEVVKRADLFGTKDIVVPYFPADQQHEQGYRQLRSDLNNIARMLESKGYRISYHNHAFEFNTMIDGESALEYILEPVPGNRVFAEIDVYWVKRGGRDPLSFIQPYANRMPIIHLKDMSDDGKQSTVEVGTGQIDFIPILRWGEQNGIEWYAVEQDQCQRDPLDCLATSLENLNAMVEKL